MLKLIEIIQQMCASEAVSSLGESWSIGYVCSKYHVVYVRLTAAIQLAWWEHRNQGREVPPAISNHTIFVADIRDVLDYQKTEIKQGDILLVRTGYVRWQL